MTEPAGIMVAFRGRLGGFALDATFAVPAAGVTAIYGPSGCGKTTVLRCIAGLQRLEGTCAVAGDIWQDAGTFRPTHRRPIGFVFQDASLFPHLSVRRNLLFGAPGADKPPPGFAFDDIIRLLGLEDLLDRAPTNLSGGERQRVAIGRALLSRPRLLLMDEPLSALDRRAKDEIIPFLDGVQRRLTIPTLYVSHDMAEVERLADTLVLMEAGRVRAAGPLPVLQSDPALPLLGTREAAVSLDATIEDYASADGIATLAVAGGRLMVPTGPVARGERRRISIVAGDVSLALEQPVRSTVLNVLRARVLSTSETGAHEITAVLGLGPEGEGARILSRVTRRSWSALGLVQGQEVFAQIKGIALVRH